METLPIANGTSKAYTDFEWSVFDESRSFDVFLCINNEDEAEARKLADELIARRIRPWLAEREVLPGRPFQPALEDQIENIDAVAVLVGPSGFGPWQSLEVDAWLREFVKRGCPVIPVLLPGVTGAPKLPVFLAGMRWVDLRPGSGDDIDLLVSGIRGRKQ